MAAVPDDFLAFINKHGFEQNQALDVGLKLAAYEIYSPKDVFWGISSPVPQSMIAGKDTEIRNVKAAFSPK